ncbi:nuclear transport factor 2 family protein [Aquamicrobium defluvii]|uniref:SnoaL-like domain-containing protein n=1 Tax=Aquamicrobium defluvii TaxID=69279 RepID=A0A011UZ87_9HYPH|nr:nuclear transport factor 2 family protein [Aquamicrobium defluvii]EXL01490.1 hypothetical protein BG36_19040 [Aquamicrobium defluvii]EZQ12734.1 hypothetical protein CF98_34715 [Halopseudomonas bauzanensis]
MIPDTKNAQVVGLYLEAMQTDDVETVLRLSIPEAPLEYPGGRRFENVTDLLAWSHGRHSFVRHNIERVDEIAVGRTATLYVSGTLHGDLTGKESFAGVRFIYRFILKDGLVAETVLWSDMADFLRQRASKSA